MPRLRCLSSEVQAIIRNWSSLTASQNRADGVHVARHLLGSSGAFLGRGGSLSPSVLLFEGALPVLLGHLARRRAGEHVPEPGEAMPQETCWILDGGGPVAGVLSRILVEDRH